VKWMLLWIFLSADGGLSASINPGPLFRSGGECMAFAKMIAPGSRYLCIEVPLQEPSEKP
jgi:hypothetical protein